MTKQDTDKRPAQERQQAHETAATATATTTRKRTRPVAGFIIAGASLALLFGIAALKGRVKDDT
ncbi:MAG TPA: hypothetical protein VK363_19440 [Pyrinomonadaceae bacterium]|nr:hypothetical protein [Pyrinomonadaceae bacterium]